MAAGRPWNHEAHAWRGRGDRKDQRERGPPILSQELLCAASSASSTIATHISRLCRTVPLLLLLRCCCLGPCVAWSHFAPCRHRHCSVSQPFHDPPPHTPLSLLSSLFFLLFFPLLDPSSLPHLLSFGHGSRQEGVGARSQGRLCPW